MGKTKINWNLELLYKSSNDPQIKKDTESMGEKCSAFSKKYKNKRDYLSNEKKLLKALVDYEELYKNLSAPKPLMYFMYLQKLDGSNKKALAQINKMTGVFTQYYNKVNFFTLNLGKIPKIQKNKFLRSKTLAHYKYFLEDIFKSSLYDLSESEERIINLKSLPAHDLWVNGLEKVLNEQTIDFKGKVLPIAEAQNQVINLGIRDRRKLQDLVIKKLKGISDFAESEINAVYIDKKIDDELRGFKEPFDSTVINYENDPKAVDNLVKAVTDRFSISKRFYKLKARIIGVDHLEYADRAVGVGKVKKRINFDEGLEIVRNSFIKVDKKYSDILDSFLGNGQIDVFPKKNKSGGAFCSSGIGTPTFVLLNHVSDINSVMTLAHEMGHAIHSEMSKTQSPIYQNYTTSVAEVASTLFEQFVFEGIFETLSESEKVYALHDKIQDDIQTIFRQIACFNFEYDLHQRIRSEGFVSKEEIALLMNKHMKSYLGPAFELKDDDGYFFVQWSHIRRFFYVYSYSYGQIISKILYQNYKKDNTFIQKIEEFLKAGRSKSPEKIFKDIGIDVLKRGFFEKGLESIEKDIVRLEKLVK